jgi:hypothetical protein
MNHCSWSVTSVVLAQSLPLPAWLLAVDRRHTSSSFKRTRDREARARQRRGT